MLFVYRSQSMAQERIQLNQSTQTEYVYVIRAIRSCPLRKKILPSRFQLHPTSGREAVSSKTVFASRDCSRFVFRKASDNLIYEKGKASGSPSYVPNPERFRWKYVMPSTVKWNAQQNWTEIWSNEILFTVTLDGKMIATLLIGNMN